MTGLRSLLGAMLFPLLISAQPATAKQLRDWHAGCDANLSCTLQTGNQDEGIYGFGFQRGHEANAPIIPFLSAAGEYANTNRITVTVDDKVFSLSSQKAENRDGVMYFNSDGNDYALINAMMAGERATLAIESQGDLHNIPISLAGVTAAALYLDEAQQRVDRRDAIKAVGTGAPQDAVSNVTALDSTSDLPPAVFSVWSANGGECSDDYGGGDLIERFGGTRVSGTGESAGKLYILPCGGPGAYNLAFTAIVESETGNSARRLLFPTMTQKGPSVMELAINTDWEPVENRLTAFAKGRGLGDCGTASTWEWSGGYYSEFILVEEYSKDECDGKDTDWPQTWPVK